MPSAVVIVVSDEGDDAPAVLRGGPAAVAILEGAGFTAALSVVGASEEHITAALRAASGSADVVVTLGGTSVREQDRVPEATRALGAGFTEVPGVAEEIRRRGASSTLASLASRGLCGVHRSGEHSAVILNAPSSTGGVRDALEVLLGVLPYLQRDASGGRRGPRRKDAR